MTNSTTVREELFTVGETEKERDWGRSAEGTAGPPLDAGKHV